MAINPDYGNLNPLESFLVGDHDSAKELLRFSIGKDRESKWSKNISSNVPIFNTQKAEKLLKACENLLNEKGRTLSDKQLKNLDHNAKLLNDAFNNSETTSTYKRVHAVFQHTLRSKGPAPQEVPKVGPAPQEAPQVDPALKKAQGDLMKKQSVVMQRIIQMQNEGKNPIALKELHEEMNTLMWQVFPRIPPGEKLADLPELQERLDKLQKKYDEIAQGEPEQSSASNFNLPPSPLSAADPVVLEFYQKTVPDADPKHPYSILDLKPSATDEEVKKAYQKLSRQFHPDKNKHEHANAAFQLISQAYKNIKDVRPDLR